MKLKTLKDLMKGKDSDGGLGVYLARDIKAEAIKWAKNVRLPSINPEKLLMIQDPESGLLVPWIKHFFNITEEDL